MVQEFRLSGERLARVSLKPHALTVSVHPSLSFTFDAEGRLIGAFLGGRHYRRGLDHRVVETSRPPPGGRDDPPIRHRRWLGADERTELLGRIAGVVGEVRGNLERTGASGSDMRDAGAWLGRVLVWDEGRYAEDRARFEKVYGSIGILPPDQYLSVVIRVTHGCAWNRCAFCDFYRDQPFRVPSLAGLRAHIGAVRDFLGASIGLRKTVFLADANALGLPREALLARLEAVRRAFPPGGRGAGREGICSFVDTFTARKGPADYRDMADLGLRRVTIGVETGDDGLRRFLDKPGTASEAVDGVGAVKAGGVSVGVILLVGAGGDRYSGAHVEGSIRALRSMGLGKGDILYLSPMVISPDSPYALRAREEGVLPLSDFEMREQALAIRRGVGGRVRWATYDIREFLC